MRGRLRITGLFLGVALALGACSGVGDDAAKVVVSGNLGAPVSIEVTGGSFTSSTRTLIEGEGLEVYESSSVVFRATSFDSRTGQVVKGYHTGDIRVAHANEEEVGDLADVMIGAHEGSRLLITRPGLHKNADDAEIVVLDILPSLAQGTPHEVRPGGGIPSIGVADGGGPVFAGSGGAIDELKVATLIEGAGQEVAQGDTIVMQYSLMDEQGTTVDTTWMGAGPATVSLPDTMRGLHEGIVDATVGSRIVIAIPAALANGDANLIAVCDILAVTTPAT